MPYSEVEIVRVRDSNPVLDVFGQLFPGGQMRRSGKVYTGFCPKHVNTNTPAFSIWPETGTWKCFGSCNAGGDVIALVRWAKDCDFQQAMEWLGGEKEEQIDSATEAAIRTAREARRKAEEELAAARIEQIRQVAIQRQIWMQWNANMTKAERTFWERTRGIPREWQDFWLLGHTNNFLTEWYGIDPRQINEDPQNLRAYTIPYFDPGGGFKTVQLRFEVQNGRGKYQFVKHLGTAASVSNPSQDLKFVVLHEGALKARIAYRYGTEGKVNTVSYPSEQDWKTVLPLLKETEVAVVWGDPGSWFIPHGWKPSSIEPRWIAHPVRLGKALKATYPSMEVLVVDYGPRDATDKVDDMLLRGDLNTHKYQHIVNTARPLSRIRVFEHGVKAK